jgi:hypothetical protein
MHELLSVSHNVGLDISHGGPKVAWVVAEGGKQIDVVWCCAKHTAREVRDLLVYGDGYSVNIEVYRPS